ncbi:tripartite motif-containing protein 16-like [Diretmus argenteus]
MEHKIAELRRKVTEVQQLSHTEDNVHFLQNSSSLSGLSESTDLPTDVRPPRCFEDVSVAVSEVRDKVEGILKEEGSKISLTVTEEVLLSRPEPKTRDEFLQYSRQITLDPNTAHTHLFLSEGNRKATVVLTDQLYPRHPDRFSGWYQVLSREDLTGRCYWEVEWRGGVSIAVSHKNISRTGTRDECGFGHNDKSWSLDCYNNSYQFTHNKISTPAPGPQSSRVGVYLDHRAGILSFYSVSGTMMTLLHRVQTSFTQTLYAGFRFNWLIGLLEVVLSCVSSKRSDQKMDPAEQRLFEEKVEEYERTVTGLVASPAHHRSAFLERLEEQGRYFKEKPWVSHFVPHLVVVRERLADFLERRQPVVGGLPSMPDQQCTGLRGDSAPLCPSGSPAPLNPRDPEPLWGGRDAQQNLWKGTRLARC